MKRNKKKTGLIERKTLVVTMFAAVFVAVMTFAVSTLMPATKKADKTFSEEVWNEAVSEAENSLKEKSGKTSAVEDSGLTSVYREESVSANAEVYPANAEKTDNGENSNETKEIPSEENAKATSKGYIPPIDGAISKDYSGDELVYSETMKDWRTHNGVDIAADEGTEVYAAADGTVEAITDNSMLGTTVIVLHSGGIRTIYSNLSPQVSAETGDAVKGGAPIGKVGSTAALESSEPSHLHFEVSVNEETVNPRDYMN